MSIQAETIRYKMQQVAHALSERITSSDEAIDGYNRVPNAMEYSDGFEWVAPASLSYYSSTGTGAPWQDRLIEEHEKAQAEEWAKQYPTRANLFETAQDDNSRWQNEAQEWIDAALHDEFIYCAFSIFRDDDELTLTAGFTDEVNRALASEFKETIDAAEFASMDDQAIQALIERVTDTIYRSN